jgi:hypothetical protein
MTTPTVKGVGSPEAREVVKLYGVVALLYWGR